jgi:hypothetical protein
MKGVGHVWKTRVLKTVAMAAQHTKPRLRDHGLNRTGDAIVIRLQGAFEAASGGMK